MDARTKSLDPPIAEGPLFFHYGNIDFELPFVTESICYESQLNLKAFIKGFALRNYPRIRWLSRDVFVIAAGELAVQRFANYGKPYTRMLKVSFESQFATPEGVSILKTCDTWAKFISSDTVLVDLLGVCLGAAGTSYGEAVETESEASQGQAGVKAESHSSDSAVSQTSESLPSKQAGPSKDPQMTAREFARLDRPDLATTAPSTLSPQPSGLADSENAKCNVSERSSDPRIRGSSHGQSSEPSARPEAAGTSSQMNEPSAGPEAATDSKATHPPCIKSQTQPNLEEAHHTQIRLGSVFNDDQVPEEEKSRRGKAGLCILCGGQKHPGISKRCPIGWTYKEPLEISSPSSGPPPGPRKRRASLHEYRGGKNRRDRIYRDRDQSSFGSSQVGL